MSANPTPTNEELKRATARRLAEAQRLTKANGERISRLQASVKDKGQSR